jgi:hypothetical protein
LIRENAMKERNFAENFATILIWDFLKVHLHPFSKIKKSIKSHKTVGIKVFLTILA